jgi:hypothetical protein
MERKMIDLVEQLRLIHLDALREFQEFTVIAAICVLGVLISVICLKKIIKHFKRVGIMFCFISAGFLYSMATKPPSQGIFNFYSGLTNQGSYATNDTVYISFSYAPVLKDDTLHIDYRDDVEKPWTRLYDGLVAQSNLVFTGIADATNLTYWIWAEYIPPPTVVTNGVYQMSGVVKPIDSPEANRWVTPGIPIRANERTLTPHDDDNELVITVDLSEDN